MPIYEYECQGCGDRHEFIQKFSDGLKRKCPSCGKPRLRKLISAAAFHLKGDGWYVTDFRDKGKSADKGKADKGKAESADGAGDANTATKPADSKTSDTKSTKTGSGTDSKSGGGSEGSSRAA